MNKRLIVHVLSKMMLFEALLLLAPALVSLIYKDYTDTVVFVTVAAFVAVFGAAVILLAKPRDYHIYAKEGFVVVALAWISWSVVGSLPFYISHAIPKYADCLFETVSGFTTTGSSVLSNIEALSKGMLFWRSFTHWVGGMGVLVFVMALISVTENNTMNLMRAEVPGPVVGKLVPKGRSNAKILYAIYLGLTVAEMIFLLLGGMPLYDSIVHAFGTAGTGGFSIKSASIAYYNSAYIDGVITVFMILFGINFNLYYFILIKKLTYVKSNHELRVFLGVVAAAMLVITLNIMPIYKNIASAFRYASFQVAAVVSTTGYSTADFNKWPELSKTILLTLMFMGGCAGSTGGGIKVSRVMLLFESARNKINKLINPRTVKPIKLEGKVVSDETIADFNAYIIMYVLAIVISVLLISVDNFDFTTSSTSVITCINNIGPGLGNIVGPAGNFAHYSTFSKMVLCFDMLLGRLEIFPMVMLLSPTIWKKKFI